MVEVDEVPLWSPLAGGRAGFRLMGVDISNRLLSRL